MSNTVTADIEDELKQITENLVLLGMEEQILFTPNRVHIENLTVESKKVFEQYVQAIRRCAQKMVVAEFREMQSKSKDRGYFWTDGEECIEYVASRIATIEKELEHE